MSKLFHPHGCAFDRIISYHTILYTSWKSGSQERSKARNGVLRDVAIPLPLERRESPCHILMNAWEKHLFIDTAILDLLEIQKKLLDQPDLFSPETEEAWRVLWRSLHKDQRTFSKEINRQSDELFAKRLEDLPG